MKKNRAAETAQAATEAFVVEWWALERITPYWRNPRRDNAAVERVAASLQEFGWQHPLVVDEQGVLIAGHVRLKAAQALGMTEAPVHVARTLSAAKARAFRIVDNSSAEVSEWDDALLADEIYALQADFAPTLLGFEAAPVDLDSAALEPWDFSLTQDECVLTVRCPLPLQADVRKRLEDLADVQIEVSIIHRP